MFILLRCSYSSVVPMAVSYYSFFRASSAAIAQTSAVPRMLLCPRRKVTPFCNLICRFRVASIANSRDHVTFDEWRELACLVETCTPGRQYGHLRCPKCHGGDNGDMSFALHVDGKAGKCGWKGSRELGKFHAGRDTDKVILVRDHLCLQPLDEEITEYFRARCISVKTLKRNEVCQVISNEEPVMVFPYKRDGIIVNCKYIDAQYNFWQDDHGEDVFYGLDDIKDKKEIIIVEREIDKLSLEEAGYQNCVSIPYGLSSEEEESHRYLDKCQDYFEKAERVILALDSDEVGQILATKLAERIGYARCFQVKWPKKKSSRERFSANEVLMVYGAEFMKSAIAKARPFPVRGLFRFREFFHEIDSYYKRELGFPFAISTGWTRLDDLYKVFPGEVTIVSGIPNSGKSEWVDALMCNLNKNVGWRFILCSMENMVRDHGRKLIEKYKRKPFFDFGYGEAQSRLTLEEFDSGKAWLTKAFYLFRSDDDSLPKISSILESAKASVLQYGVRGIVIDPYNEIDHESSSYRETEFVSQMLTKLRCFAQSYDCHVWLVAHPRQVSHLHGQPPDIYDISGSAHFISKCDNCIMIHRDRQASGCADQVQVHVLKVRNKLAGRIGTASLSYNRVTGEYF
eukprot:TRINITY_DN15166_c0_g1_i1.p1 TRINITY_DN15166_c0_g1~~TRINITY_DN15166_c0_g1_i1.p1  ORF type:complete len:628 (-),score=92.37 TRINITY_DN15166_c0_g1_i1:418-2301(-)